MTPYVVLRERFDHSLRKWDYVNYQQDERIDIKPGPSNTEENRI